MTYEAGNDPQGRGRAGAEPTATPSERGAEAEPGTLHDPVQAEQQRSTARDFGVTGAGASHDVGPLNRPPAGPGSAPGQREGHRAGQERQEPPVPPAHAPRQDRGLGGEQQHAAPAGATGTAAPDGGHRPTAGATGAGTGTGLGAGTGTSQGAGTGTGVNSGTSQGAGAGTGLSAGTSSGAGTVSGSQLLPHGERDKLGLRLQQAVNQFVDEPRRAVEEADHVLEEAARHIADTLAEHRRSLRGSWESKDRETETEELRVALRKYREVTERLLQL